MKCEKINTCGSYVFASCVKYEGEIPSFSKYFGNCNVYVEDTIEELYTLINSNIGEEYFNGVGILLIDNTFSADFGTTSGKVMEGSWRPRWEDISNPPTIPTQVNIIAGTNITVEGTYPNIKINSTGSGGQNNIIEKITLGGIQASVIDKTAIIPIATKSVLGIVKIGEGLSVASDGTLTNERTPYFAGNGLTLTGTTFTLPITINGTGDFVKSVTQGSNGLNVELGTPTGGGIYPSGTLLNLQQGTSGTDMVWSPLTINQWYDNNRLSIINQGSSTAIKSGVVEFESGTNMTITQVGNKFTFASTGGSSPSYTPGNGIAIAGNIITNTLPNASHTGDVTGATNLSITNGVVTNNKLATSPPLTLKGNATGATATVQDLDTSTVRSMLNLTNQTIIVNSSMTISLQERLHTAVLVDNETGTITVTVPNGEFDGQIVSIYANNVSQDTVNISGQFMKWNPNKDSVTTFNLSVEYAEHLYWHDGMGKWVLTYIRQ